MVKWKPLRSLWRFCLVLSLALGLIACAGPGAEQRIFLDVSLSLLDTFELPPQTFENTRVGGISALAYDRPLDRIYALSDEHSSGVAPHFYTLKMEVESEPPHIKTIALEAVTFFRTPNGTLLDSHQLDPEGLSLTPQGTLWVSSEGVQAQKIPPALVEFDRTTGTQIQTLPVPDAFIATIDPQTRQPQKGVQSNLGLEALSLSPTGSSPAAAEPLRLFTVNESPLIQDIDLSVAEEGGRLRFLHYYLTEPSPLLISTHVYSLAPVPLSVVNGLSEMLTLDGTGHFLTLERSLTPFGFQVQLFQAAIAGASDIQGISALQGELSHVNRVQKQLVLNLNHLDIPIRNVEGMTWGPLLPDGSPTLLLVSDNNFEAEPTQFLWFKVQL